MKGESLLKSVDTGLSVFKKIIHITLLLGIILFGVKSYAMVHSWFVPKTTIALPYQSLEDIVIVVDDNYHKYSKSPIQKFKEWIFRNDVKEYSKISYQGNKLNIIVDGQYGKINAEIKKQLCFIYSNKYSQDIDLNKKRVDEVLKNLYCF
jgi:hypothetical protein